MSPLRITRFLPIAVAIGALLGFLFPAPFRGPERAEATGTFVWLGNHPGATSTINCGRSRRTWHTFSRSWAFTAATS